MKTVELLGQECSILANQSVELLVARSAGPRVLSYRFLAGKNIFAELPHFTAECPGEGIFHFLGGHRLWHAPEEPRRTYLPDNAPVNISPSENGLAVTQAVEAKTGIQKSLEIQLVGETARVIVTHRLTNHGLWPVSCVPWAITQLKAGGFAILPQNLSQSGELPNRALALWPYTNMNQPSVHWEKDLIWIETNMDTHFKIGFPNPRGWLAYWVDATLFIKRAAYDPQQEYYDFGSSSECYCCDEFLELETLAPIQVIAPNETVSHVETWDLYPNIKQPRDAGEIRALINTLGLDAG